MKRWLFLLLFLPALVWAGTENSNNSSSQVCKSFTLACSSPPCFPLGGEGWDFSGTNAQYNLTLHVISGSLSIDFEGRNPAAGSFFPISNFTTGFDGFFLRNPPVIRAVVLTGANGTGVLCGNS